MENPIDPIGNQIRNLPASRAVPQLTVPPRTPVVVVEVVKLLAVSIKRRQTAIKFATSSFPFLPRLKLTLYAHFSVNTTEQTIAAKLPI